MTSLDPYTLMTIFIKMLTHVLKLTKGEITTTNIKNMAIMAIPISFASNVYDAFLLSKMDINCERKEKYISIWKHLEIESGFRGI